MADETGGGWKMARETKVGLVVAGSFLLLVGVVVFCKLREGNPSPPDTRAEIKDEIVPEEPAPSEKPVPSPEAASPEATAVAVAPPAPETRPVPVVDPLVPPPPSNIVPDNDTHLQPAPAGGAGPTVVPVSGADPRTPLPEPLPPPVTPPVVEVSPPPPATGDPPPVAPPESSPSGPPPVAPPPSGTPLTPPPPPVLETGTPPAVSPPAMPADTRSPSGPIDPPPPPATGSAGTAVAPPSTEIRSVAPVPPADARGGLPPAVISPPVPPENRGSAAAPGSPGGVSLVPPTGSTPIPPATGGVSTSPPPARSGVEEAVRRNPIPAAPPPPVTPPDPAATSSGRSVGTPTNPGAPPITIPASPAVARTPPAAAPQVESFDEEEYRVRQGDTFQAISTRFYRTDKYAPALLLFNRNHPLANPGVRQEPPVLQQGQAVFIPPTRILEKRYGTAIPELTAPAAPASGVTGERSSNASPGAAVPPSSPQYRVQGSEEMLWSIAQRYLGNGERWRDIHKLNPTIRPELPLPPGTVLYLPADAQAQPAARP